MYRYVPGLLALASGLIAGCGSNAPTAPTSTGAGALPVTFSLSGRVADVAGVAIHGAVVTIADGTESTLTDGNGHYELRGLPGGPLTVRASKDGYVASTSSVELPRTYPADFILAFTGPSFNLAGDYTVTFVADPACTQLPPAARARTYSASIAPLLSPNDYWVSLSGARFYYNAFTASVAGNSASFSTLPDGNEAIVHERLTDSTSIWIDFFARAAVDVPRVTVPMFGHFAYCPDDHLSTVFTCRVARVTCTSSYHTFTLTRR
jgi:hypothetical protein